MNPEELSQNISRVSDGLAPMLSNFMNTARLRIAASATTKYMKDAGVTEPPFPPRKSSTGPLRILTGRLASSISQARFDGGAREGIAELEVSSKGATMKLGTRVPYARVHEEGFRGIMYVRPHHRTITEAFGKKLSSPKRVQIQEYAYRTHIRPRPYLGPASDDNEEYLQDLLSEQYQKLVLDAIDGK